MEPDLKELLHRKAEYARIPADLPRETFHRARRRRGWTAAFAGVTTITLIAGTVVALQSTVFSNRRPIGENPTPSTTPTEPAPIGTDEFVVPAAWPETNTAAIEAEQTAVDTGADPWRTDPIETARAFGRTVLGWNDVDVEQFGSRDQKTGSLRVNLQHGPQKGAEAFWASTGVNVELAQLARSGDGGVWSVVDVASGDMPIEAGPDNVDSSAHAGPRACVVDHLVPSAPAALCGTITHGLSTASVRWALFTGDTIDLGDFETASMSASDVSLSSFAPPDPETARESRDGFYDLISDQLPENSSLLLVEALDASGGVIVAGIQRVRSTTRTSEPIPPTPTEAPTPVPPPLGTEYAVPAVWPEANLDDIQAVQQAVDAGSDPWRTDVLATATAFARDVMRWDGGVSAVPISGDDNSATAVVGLLHAGAGDSTSNVRLDMARLATTGSRGVWSVVDASSRQLSFEAGPSSGEASCGPDQLEIGSPAMLCGVASTPFAAGTIARYALFQGDAPDLGVYQSAPVWGEIPLEADGTFVGGMTENVVGDATVLLVEVVDPDGRVAVAATERVPVAGTTEPTPPQPTTGPQAEIPEAVASVRDAIQGAARDGDYEQLRPLIGDRFSFSFGDVGGQAGDQSSAAGRAIAFWQRDGTRPLEVMSALLDMPYATVPGDGGRIYVWPGIFDWTPDQLRHIDEIAPEWRSALEQIYPDFDRQLQSWIDFGGYQGWRIGITEDGRWLYFIAGD